NDSQTIILDVVNPVFTLQQIKDGTNVHIVGMVRDNVTYSGNTGVSRNGRITRLYITLDDTSGTYTFSDCLEFPTLLETDWHVPLKLGVEFASALKTSDSIEVNLPEDPGDPVPTDLTEPSILIPTGPEPSVPAEISDDSSKTKIVYVTRLKPGTYTVTANIFLKKEDTKLPMNPHLTSGVFPPKDPVSNNATLIVAEDGTAKVIIPITITVMSLNSISGLNIINMEKDASGAIKSLTINLGRLDNPGNIITKRCNVSVTLSELAQSISGFGPDHNWPATFELALAGVPTVQVETTADANNPQTGDDTPLAAYTALLLVSLGCMGCLAFRRKRRGA
ncbi:MAG TPA: hypothetical protein VN381_05100, partial [Anaerovoracaceae bacterium]|nr:hypothetical protein [Anaerovoracaceae bacterium]